MNFPSLLNLTGDKDLGKQKDRICDHLSRLQDAIDKFFPSISTMNLDWVVSPFDFVESAEEIHFAACERDDSTLKGKFFKSEASVATFWLQRREEYPNLMKKAINALLPFSTSYLCEQAFSAMVTIKSKARNRLNNLEDDLHVSLSTVRPDISRICALSINHKFHINHLLNKTIDVFLLSDCSKVYCIIVWCTLLNYIIFQ